MTNLNNNFQPLTPAVFYILLALATEERHGYGIMKQVTLDSDGKVSMGPGTLYGSLKRMLDDKLVEETETRKDKDSDERRKYYKITSLGRKHLQAELGRYKSAIHIAQKSNIAGLWKIQSA